jgi:hypothetical protein
MNTILGEKRVIKDCYKDILIGDRVSILFLNNAISGQIITIVLGLTF